MNRADAAMRRYAAWQQTAFVASHIGGGTVAAIVLVPPLLVPLLPSSDVALPILGTLWLMAASGATGVYLLDVSRLSGASAEPVWSRVRRQAARVIVVAVGLAGVVAGVVVLTRMQWLIEGRASSWVTVAGAVFVAGTVIMSGLSLARRALGGRGHGSSARHGA